MNKMIYADNAAPTRITQPVLKAMLPYLLQPGNNPHQLHSVVGGVPVAAAQFLFRPFITENHPIAPRPRIPGAGAGTPSSI